jgi:hypothetical protein
MFKTKFLATILVVLAVLFGQVGGALAAPAAQDPTPITGTIQTITTETDTNGVTTVLVTVVDGLGATQTYRLSVDTAVTLGLVSLDPTTNEPVVDLSKVGQSVTIDPTTVIPDEVPDEEPFNPVAGLLASFFGVDNASINQLHEDGYGLGVIAQALWMADGLGDGDLAETAGLILEAKSTGDYSAFVLPDGSTPTNWGQFKKALLGKDKKNLGIIVSGHAEPLGTDAGATNTQDHGNGKDKDKGNNGNGKGKNP